MLRLRPDPPALQRDAQEPAELSSQYFLLLPRLSPDPPAFKRDALNQLS
jgi:hypothetical protein